MERGEKRRIVFFNRGFEAFADVFVVVVSARNFVIQPLLLVLLLLLLFLV